MKDSPPSPMSRPPTLCENMMPARAWSHLASDPTIPVVTSPSVATRFSPSLDTSASMVLVATRPYLVKTGIVVCRYTG